jgi:hypothetical protein
VNTARAATFFGLQEEERFMSSLRRVMVAGVAAFVLAVPFGAHGQTTSSVPQGATVLLRAPADFSELARSRLPSVVAVTTRQRVEETSVSGFEDLPFGEQFRRFF